MVNKIITELEANIDLALFKLEEHIAYEYDGTTGRLSKRGNEINAVYTDIESMREDFRRKYYIVGEDELNMIFSIDKD